MKINTAALMQLAENRGWSIPSLAGRLGIDYSYLFRVLHNEKKGGVKLLEAIYRFCQEEGLSVDDYLEFEIANKKQHSNK